MSMLEYRRFSSLEDALRFLSERPDAKIVAGGTDLVVQMRMGKLKPSTVADIRGIRELRGIRESDEGLEIGALTTIEEIRESSLVERLAPPLWEAAQEFATWQIRNMGTLGGNLCNASPAADTAPPLMVLGARVRTARLGGGRTIPIEEFFRGPGETILEKGELLTHVHIPRPGDSEGHAFQRLGRRVAHILSIVSAAAAVGVEDGRIGWVRVALGSVAPTPVRARTVERELTGKTPSRDLIKSASEKVLNDIKPISDVRASAEYRRAMSVVLVRRVLEKALRRAGA